MGKRREKIVPRVRGGGVVLSTARLKRLTASDPRETSIPGRRLRALSLPRRKASALRAK